MKKNILSLVVLAAALAFALPSQAQIKFGVKAGLNVNSFSVKNIELLGSKKNRNGFFAGVTADVTLPIVGLGADASLLYDNRCIGFSGPIDIDDDYDYDGDGVPEIGDEIYGKTHKTFHYISLPINAKYTVGLSSLASVYVATGPQFSWNIGDRHWSMGDWDDGWELKSSQFSWNVGCGATVLSHVRVGYNYNIALGNTAEIKVEDVAGKIVKGKLKNNTHQISLTYLF
ncbi:MAG: PorT family protein [Bacteroidaceae bacterium]|nr:PorT family protein [Bacteroidaceae bacterium]